MQTLARWTVVLTAFTPTLLVAQQAPTLPDSLATRVDRVFAAFTSTTPGCGVGISLDGKPAYIKAFGMANLEYGVPNTERTVWESGSVAKQFTSAAVVLLALDGRLSLEDDIRKYLPEVPAFADGVITIRMLLNHTSGLRDQWGLLGLMNNGPGQQVHSPETTLDLVAHQKRLNFPPGTRYMYSNTGYSLAGIIVQRVSGKSLDAFSQERLFRPLGMTGTQWRDDFNEIVKDRATAYGGGGRGGLQPFRTNMPITNMVGNGGLLFTVGDVLQWNINLDDPVVGGKAWRDSLEVRGRLKNGRQIPYALGLIHGVYNGAREISHSGSTAGYQTWIGRYPEHRLSIAVLCNVASAAPTQLAHQVADIFIPRVVAQRPPRPAAVPLTPGQASAWTGIYRDPFSNSVIRFSSRDGAVGFNDPPEITLSAASPAHVFGPAVDYVMTQPRAGLRRVLRIAGDDTTEFVEAARADTSAATRAQYVGAYASDEIDARLAVTLHNGRLVLVSRPADTVVMVPVFRDGFTAAGQTLVFSRDRAGKVTGFSVFAGRIIDVRFARISSNPRL